MIDPKLLEQLKAFVQKGDPATDSTALIAAVVWQMVQTDEPQETPDRVQTYIGIDPVGEKAASV